MYVYLYSDYPETRIGVLKSMCELIGIEYSNVYFAQKDLLEFLRTTWSEFHPDLYLELLDKVLEIEADKDAMLYYQGEKERISRKMMHI